MNKWNLKREWFDGVRAFNAFMYACDVMEKVKTMQDNDYLLFDENGIIDGDVFININANDSTVGIGCCIYAGCTHGGENLDLIYLTKKEFNETMSNLRIVNPKHIIKFNKSTTTNQ